MTTPVPQGFPNVSTPLVTSDGMIQQSWLRLLISVWKRTGGNISTPTTGSGSIVLQDSPILITPNLGTPSAINLSNGSDLPLGSAVTGILPIVNGGTGSSTQNFVDLTTSQTIEGIKSFLGQLIGNGTSTNDNATSGIIGEYISSTVLVGSAVTLTSGATSNITSISLTPGDWDVWGQISTNPATGTITTSVLGWISPTSATLPTVPNNGAFSSQYGLGAGVPSYQNVGTTRISLATSTTIYLSTQAVFTTSTNTAYGFIGARRRR